LIGPAHSRKRHRPA